MLFLEGITHVLVSVSSIQILLMSIMPLYPETNGHKAVVINGNLCLVLQF